MSKKHMGSSVDDFLKEEGIFEEAQAVKEVVAWQLAEAMKKKKISKNKMAKLPKTSRTQVDRLLSAKDDIILSSLQRAAAMVGRRVTIELESVGGPRALDAALPCAPGRTPARDDVFVSPAFGRHSMKSRERGPAGRLRSGQISRSNAS